MIRYILPLLLLLPFGLFSQKYIEKAQNAFDASEYYTATQLLKSAYSRLADEPKLKAKIAFQTGYCYRQLSRSDMAELWLSKAIELQFDEPQVFLYCADALLMNEKYQEALENYEKYKKLIPSDARTDKMIRSCRIAIKWTENPTKYQVTNVAYLNSENSDYSPMPGNKDATILYFSSCRAGANGDKIHGGTGQSFADLFSSSKDTKGSWSQPYQLENTINTENEEGVCTFNADFSAMLLTRCEYSEKKASPCKLLVSQYLGDSWSKPDEVPIEYDKKDTVDFAHPSLSKDGLKLYFTSNLKGGQGGFDIWYIQRESKDADWSAPVNAGNIVNSEGHEKFPYIRHDDVLFFASNGHHGMGGLDLFRVNKDPKGKEQLVNLMYPLNSPADDFGICFEENEERGYFSSNRKASIGQDDIFHFVLPPLTFNVKGKVLDELKDSPIADAKVRLIGNDGASLETTTNSKGEYTFKLKPGTNYIILASKKGFLNGKGKLTTDGLEDDKDFDIPIYMTTVDLPVEIPNIMYDVGKWELRPESIVALEKLIDILNDNPEIVIELSSHTDYRPGRISNIELSQKRAQSVVDYLIIKGIEAKRLVAKGYGESSPKTVDKKNALQYTFLREGQLLTKAFIESLPANQKEIAHQINRRTELKVLSSNFEN
ncbi:MAG: OmpA family protein [Bacteroidales bacterium]|nr:OmpA family protein [Bacteroidales bacterium]